MDTMDQPTEHNECEESSILEVKLKNELTNLFNKHSVDNLTNTPDFILAESVIQFISNIKVTNDKRDQWFGLKQTQELKL